MGPIGMQEMIVIFLVALLLFGPRKLPELGKNLAKAMSEFRRAQSDLKATFDREMANIERENESLKETAKQTAAEISGYTDFDLIGGDNHYGTQSGSVESTASGSGEAFPATELPGQDAQAETYAGETSTVSASEGPGAESPAESESAPHATTAEARPETASQGEGVEGTVARNGVTGTRAEAQPAPEAALNS